MTIKYYKTHIYYFRLRLLIGVHVKYLIVIKLFRNHFQTSRHKIQIVLETQIEIIIFIIMYNNYTIDQLTKSTNNYFQFLPLKGQISIIKFIICLML